jgi:hypothetical protein
MAKWLTRWSAKPVFAGSIPARCSNKFNSLWRSKETAELATVAENVASAALFCVPALLAPTESQMKIAVLCALHERSSVR